MKLPLIPERMGPKAKVEKGMPEKKKKHWSKPPAAPKAKAADTLPNSLESNIGTVGYDADGVRLLRNVEGRYNWPETARTLELWMRKNDCHLLLDMFVNPALEGYPRYDPDDLPAVDEERYNNERFYRSTCDNQRALCDRLHPEIKKQETRVMSKLESLVDTDLLTKMMQDEEYDWVVRENRRPHFYRVLIVDAINSGVGVGSADARENLRKEWVNFEMCSSDQPLSSYKRDFDDLMARSTACNLVYTEFERANKFIKGCSGKWSDFVADVLARPEARQPQTLAAALEELQRYQNAQVAAHGSFVSAAPLSQQYAMYHVGKRGEKKRDAEVSGSSMRWTEDGQPICARCGGKGHKMAQCPTPAKICAVRLVANINLHVVDRYILLDDGAEASTFCSNNLLDNVFAEVRSELTTAQSGSKITTTEVGDFMGIEVMVSDDVDINLLSEADVMEYFRLYSIEGWGTRAVHKESGHILDFCLRGKTKWLDLKNPVKLKNDEFIQRYNAELKRKSSELKTDIVDRDVRVAALTVADRARVFTVAERKRAEEARLFVNNSGCRGMGTLIRTVPRLANCPITAQDIRNQAYIYGMTEAQVKGRTVWQKPRVLNRDGAAPLLIKRDVKLLMDPMVLLNEHFLVGVVKPLSLGLISHVKGVSASSLKAGMTGMINTCHAFRLRPTELVIDPERGLKTAAMSTGVGVTEVGPGDHVPDAESMILVCKNIARSTVHGLPYMLPKSLVKALGMYAMRCRNVFHTSATGEIPMESATGVKVDARELKIGFGDHVEVRVRKKKGNMSRMDECTRSAVALYPFGKYGSWRVRFLDTWTEGASDRPILINMDKGYIEKMNDRCKGENPDDSYLKQLGELRKSQTPEAEKIMPPETVEADHPDIDVDMPNTVRVEDLSAREECDHTTDAINNSVVVDSPIAKASGDGETECNKLNMRIMRSGNEYLISYLTRKGKHSQLIASMKQGATKTTFAKALRAKGSKADKALSSAIAEVKQIDDKGSWHPVRKQDLSREERRAIVRTFMFVIDKFTPDGELLKVKARLVAMGNMQNAGSISIDTSSPTVDITSVLATAAINAHEERFKMTCDVGGAFLHTVWPKTEGRQIVHLDRVNTRILLQVRPDYTSYVQDDGTLLMELDRALYGLIQSARLWYDRLTEVLSKGGYKVNQVDPCVWNHGTGIGQCTVLFHVDDLSCSSTNLEKLKALEAVLVNEFGEEHIKCVYGDKQEYLGMLFKYTNKKVQISMSGYIQAILDFSGTDQSKRAKTPATSSLFMLKENAPKLNAERAKLFHSLVQAVSYAAQRVRWDLLLAVGFLKGRVSAPDETDWSKLMRMLHYLNGTKDLALNLGVIDNVVVDSAIDASHAVYEDARSQGGLAISLGLGVVQGRSHRLSLNTKSSAESELVTTSDNVPEVIHLRSFLEGQGYKMGPSIVRQDNQAAIRLLEKGRSDSKRTKHINTRFFFVHDRIKKGEVVLQYTPTEDMVADFFTKPLQGNLFLRMRDKLLGFTVFSEG